MHFAQHFARVHLFVIVCTRDKISNTGPAADRIPAPSTAIPSGKPSRRSLHARLEVGTVGESRSNFAFEIRRVEI